MKIIKTKESLDIHVRRGFIYDIPLSRMQTPEAKK